MLTNNNEEKLLNGFSRQELFDLLVPDYEAGTLIRKMRKQRDTESTRAYRTWVTRFAGKRADRENSIGYMEVSLGNKKLLAHRILWFMRTGEVPIEIDHKNGITTDNSQENLRNVTHDKNLENAKDRINSSTGITGVHYYKSRNKWTAHITKHGRTKCLGYFLTIEEAISARLKAEEEVNFERFQ